jgi:murein DD-endopeptidase MepM/ murein hydrolase activator NlpD
VPRNQRFPHARARRRPPWRFAAIAVAGAFAVLLAWPTIHPTGKVLDLVGDAGSGAAAVGQGPTPAGKPTPPSAGSHVPPATPLTPVASPRSPGATPRPTAAAQLAGPSSTTSPTRLPSPSDVPLSLTFGANTVTTAPPIESLVGYVWPLAHPRLTLPFGPTVWGTRWVNGERFHDGVDLATFCGDRVVAVHTGTVLTASRHYDAYMGWLGDLGPYLKLLDQRGLWPTLPIVIVIDDGNGYRSVYAHFSKVTVKPGQRVKAGQLIGYEGMTGRASGCHLHYDLFSPLELAPMAIRADVVKRMKVPKAEIARIDPLLVLPPKAGINAPARPKPSSREARTPVTDLISPR